MFKSVQFILELFSQAHPYPSLSPKSFSSLTPPTRPRQDLLLERLTVIIYTLVWLYSYWRHLGFKLQWEVFLVPQTGKRGSCGSEMTLSKQCWNHGLRPPGHQTHLRHWWGGSLLECFFPQTPPHATCWVSPETCFFTKSVPWFWSLTKFMNFWCWDNQCKTRCLPSNLALVITQIHLCFPWVKSAQSHCTLPIGSFYY